MSERESEGEEGERERRESVWGIDRMETKVREMEGGSEEEEREARKCSHEERK